MTLPCHSASELFAPTIPRSQQGRQQTVSFIYSYHSCLLLFFCLLNHVPTVLDGNMFFRTVGGEMCIIGEKWDAGCGFIPPKRHSGGHLQQQLERKSILSFCDLFWELKELI